jgi:hypothetical protein
MSNAGGDLADNIIFFREGKSQNSPYAGKRSQ